MLQVIRNFVNSEKAVATGLLVIASSVLTAMGQMSIDQWMGYTQVMAGIYVGGKSVQGAAAALSGAKKANEENEQLRAELAKNDAGADAALDEKFAVVEDDAE